MASISAAASPVRTASARVSRRLLAQSSPLMGEAAPSSCCPNHDAISSDNNAGSLTQTRAISSISRPSITLQSSSNSSFVPPTYSSLRNKVTMPAGVQAGQSYVSPYAEFFANVEANRTSLGTTEEMEQRAFELKEQHLECGIPESELRFETKSYGRLLLAPYVAAGEHRVTLKVKLSAIPFENEEEKDVFLQIVGPRYNEKKGILKLSSEKFASRIENKRYLVDMIERLVSSARSLSKEFAAEDDTSAATAK